MRTTRIPVLGLLLLIIGCQNNQSKKLEAERLDSNNVVKEVPEWYANSDSKRKEEQALFRQLKLDSLENGFDSLQIRIWIDCGYNVSDLILIERSKNGWNAVFYSFIAQYDESYNLEIKNVNAEKRLPKSGWEIFLENLLRTNLIELPDYSRFYPKYNYPTDAYRVLVEIATITKFRLYEYPELGLNLSIANGPAKLHEALVLIEKEFDYKRPCQASP